MIPVLPFDVKPPHSLKRFAVHNLLERSLISVPHIRSSFNIHAAERNETIPMNRERCPQKNAGFILFPHESGINTSSKIQHWLNAKQISAFIFPLPEK
jgi:hypothetical protein